VRNGTGETVKSGDNHDVELPRPGVGLRGVSSKLKYLCLSHYRRQLDWGFVGQQRPLKGTGVGLTFLVPWMRRLFPGLFPNGP
jgi:hypothetical protein